MQKIDVKKVYLVTGTAGFIGYYLSRRLLTEGCRVIGADNLNDYYDVELKEERLSELLEFEQFTFCKTDIADAKALENIFAANRVHVVIHLAAQAGVRYSIQNPQSYINSNLVGFANVLECCRNYHVEHLLFASSSSVYGNQQKVPFSESDQTDQPVSLYAATKKSNELLAYSYSHLYHIPMTGMRFFTVYGPKGRPDMAYYSFAEKIMRGESIKIFNQGDLYRDFTYIDDIIEGIMRLIGNSAVLMQEPSPAFKVYNIGNNKPEKLMYFVETLEKCLGRTAVKEFMPMQPGDVYQTYADVSELERDVCYHPTTSLEQGLEKFAEWYLGKWKEKKGCQKG